MCQSGVLFFVCADELVDGGCVINTASPSCLLNFKDIFFTIIIFPQPSTLCCSWIIQFSKSLCRSSPGGSTWPSSPPSSSSVSKTSRCEEPLMFSLKKLSWPVWRNSPDQFEETLLTPVKTFSLVPPSIVTCYLLSRLWLSNIHINIKSACPHLLLHLHLFIKFLHWVNRKYIYLLKRNTVNRQ